MTNHLPKILEASLTELIEIERQLLVLPLSIEIEAELFYCQALIHFFRQNTSGLEILILSTEKRKKDLTYQQVISLAQLRLQYRIGSLNTANIHEWLQKHEIQSFHEILQGEASFLIAMAFQQLSLYLEADNYFKQAAYFFENSGIKLKAFRSQLSALAAYSCQYPDARLFPEYSELAHQAKKEEEWKTVGTAFLNISREFQRISALDIALEYVTRSLEAFEKKHFGSREHGLALIHKSHICFQLGRKAEALRAFYFGLNIKHPDIQAGCQVLKENFQIDTTIHVNASPLPTWLERKNEVTAQFTLGKLESLFIQHIAEEGKTKFQLIDLIYGDKIDIEYAEGRLKNLISRIRSRYPDLIVLEKGLYRISDPIALNKVHFYKKQEVS